MAGNELLCCCHADESGSNDNNIVVRNIVAKQKQGNHRWHTLPTLCTPIPLSQPIMHFQWGKNPFSACHRRTKQWTQATCTENLVKIACVVPEISSWTDRQTDRQTHRQTYSSQYFATTPVGEVITLTSRLWVMQCIYINIMAIHTVHDTKYKNAPRLTWDSFTITSSSSNMAAMDMILLKRRKFKKYII